MMTKSNIWWKKRTNEIMKMLLSDCLSNQTVMVWLKIIYNADIVMGSNSLQHNDLEAENLFTLFLFALNFIRKTVVYIEFPIAINCYYCQLLLVSLSVSVSSVFMGKPTTERENGLRWSHWVDQTNYKPVVALFHI